MVSSPIYLMILKLYLSKERYLSRSRFCEIIGISYTNYSSYKRVINILSNVVFVENNRVGYEKSIFIDRNKLDDFICSTDIFRETEEFIVKSRAFAIT